ncbi:tetratricopeptide repeat protein [Phenylobacterium sp.]|jgi:hypothetical protein|uniref:tetratricopeptide repeat protein n=1 Tax=Phenylobacterium sp. TaxID=1871053 RepID=UPI0037844AA8
MAEPSPFDAAFEAGQRLQQQRQWAAAAEAYRAAARLGLTVRLAANLGLCLHEAGDYAEAERWLQLAARHQPANPNIRQRLGLAYAALDKPDLAELELRTSLAFRPGDPATELALGGLLLSLGRLTEGWPLMEARVGLHRRAVPAVTLPYPEWLGEPLEGRSILVQVEQGLGDQIQMARFAAHLKARGAGRVTLTTRSPLKDLLARAPGVDATVAVDAGARVALDRHDLWTRYFTLPGRVNAGPADLWSGPYLSAPPERLARWAPGARVGLVWQASPTGFNGARKSLPADQARRLLDRGLMSLHPEDTGVGDMADTAAIVAGLDLVVSIDTSVAHLAGAMGQPVWTLLPFHKTDWRWMRGRRDSPWYPTMRLYRHADREDWRGMVDQVLAELEAEGL